MSEIPILIAGDPHGHWRPIHIACRQSPQVGMLILLGDCDLMVPLAVEFADEIRDGWDIRYIIGNHDTDNIEAYDGLVASLPHADIGGRVLDVNHIRLAGLGGTYRGRIWYPRLPDAPVLVSTRQEYMRRLKHFERWRGGLPLPVRSAIFPEDHAVLRGGRLDVLVCHEAPDIVRMKGKGFHGMNELLDATGTKLCVHGHHHTSYVEDLVLPSGRICEVRGLAIGEVWKLEMPL